MNPKILMKMAKSNRWQSLYTYCKELGNIRLFHNSTDLTKIQIMFLNFLQTYRILYEDLASDKDYISEEVIQDDLRTEAYLLLRRQKSNDKNPKNDTQRAIDSRLPGVRFIGK